MQSLTSHQCKYVFLSILLFTCFSIWTLEEHITPYKFSDPDNIPLYEIPASARLTIPRPQKNAPPISYYISTPTTSTYPIIFLCSGSSSKNRIDSIIHFHRYFLQECMDLNLGVITVEQWGVDGVHVKREEFMHHYTRTQRLLDHCTVIEHLIAHPPAGWNGKLVFLGVSEGGPLVTSLTTKYAPLTLATINWCGSGNWNWREELWAFIVAMRKNTSWWFKIVDFMPQWIRPSSLKIPKTKKEFDKHMDATLKNPTYDTYFLGMTYAYHADALCYPNPDYKKIRTPLLVVAGVQDSIIESCDEFVQKAQESCAPITYIRVEDMDHYIRKRPDIIQQSFQWLERQLAINHDSVNQRKNKRARFLAD